LPVLVLDLHLGCPSPTSQLAGNDQLLRWASLPARLSDKVVTRVGIATATSLPGRSVKRDNPASSKSAIATTAVLTYGPVDPTR